MAIPQNGRANAAHVNMMTDTVIANLPADGLRVIMRALLAYHPETTSVFEHETRKYIEQGALTALKHEWPTVQLRDLREMQMMIRCMLGSGLCFQSLPLLSKLARKGSVLSLENGRISASEVQEFLASIDGDIVQTITAVQKQLLVVTGARDMTNDEQTLVQHLYETLIDCQGSSRAAGQEYPYGRGLTATASVLGIALVDATNFEQSSLHRNMSHVSPPAAAKETFDLNGRSLPRIFSGLWQMSSPAWGSASTSKIIDELSKHVGSGLTAFDMADHYGDAEIVFGRFVSAFPHKEAIFTATKYCVFHSMIVSEEAVRSNISERCQRLQQDRIDLLQFHWQVYDNPQYIDALRFISRDERVRMIGLCNFDTKHLEEVLESGIPVHTNQVQFSLIDSRPTVKMGHVCKKYNIKLLTYGTLCGGFLADKWLNKPEPDVYDKSITPSQRKYHAMIRSWGDWDLFQELLRTLDAIASRHGVGISNVATRWVLDFPYVGAVIVGVRMGISEHTHENLASFGWSLDQQDHDAIEKVLARSRRMEVYETMGDCGAEYRTSSA